MASVDVLIRVDGGYATGFGHLYRMAALAGALAAVGRHVSFCTKAGTDGEGFLRTRGYQVTPVDNDGLLVDGDIFARRQTGAIVLDVLDTECEAFRHLRAATSAPVICFDDMGAGLEMADAVINAIVGIWGDYPRGAVSVPLYEGPEYLVLQDRISTLRDERRSMPARARNLLLAFGATDDHGLTRRALKALDRVEEALNIQVNLGPGVRCSAAVYRQAAGIRHAVQVSESAPSIIDLMAAADLMVCAGGMMAFEAAALGTPIAAMAGAVHERNSIAYLASLGCAIDLDASADEDVAGRFHEVIADADARHRMSVRGQGAVDGDGLTRCARIIDDMIG